MTKIRKSKKMPHPLKINLKPKEVRRPMERRSKAVESMMLMKLSSETTCGLEEIHPQKTTLRPSRPCKESNQTVILIQTLSDGGCFAIDLLRK